MPLCLAQQSTLQAKAWADQFGMTTWWAASTEIHSAIARVYRSGELLDSLRIIALSRLAVLREEWDEIPPTDIVRNMPRRLFMLTHSAPPTASN